jgi:hypothetical protein
LPQAQKHWAQLYRRVPRGALEWDGPAGRGARLLAEVARRAPDVVALQEVDRFQELRAALAALGCAAASLECQFCAAVVACAMQPAVHVDAERPSVKWTRAPTLGLHIWLRHGLRILLLERVQRCTPTQPACACTLPQRTAASLIDAGV